MRACWWAALRPGRLVREGHQPVHEVEVAGRRQPRDQVGPGRVVLLADVAVDACHDRPAHQAGGLVGDQVPEHLVQDLGVAGSAEEGGEPAELVAQRLGDVAVEEPAVAGHGVPQTADRDPHVVHRLGRVVAYPRVEPS